MSENEKIERIENMPYGVEGEAEFEEKVRQDASMDVGERDEDEASKKQAERVLKAIEMLIDSDEKIIAVAKKMRRRVMMAADDADEPTLDEKTLYMRTGAEIIAHYANRASISGGVSGLPAMLPGIGSLIGFVGTAAVDVVYMLKFEVEMSLALFWLAGLDIAQERIRKLAVMIVTVVSADILKNKKGDVDAVSLVEAAFWGYSVRQLSRHLITRISGILVVSLSRQLVRTLPVLGIVVGATVNKVMLRRTGNACLDALWVHRNTINVHDDGQTTEQAGSDVVYDAEFLD
ncbi:MAG: hypothetical protein IIY06_13125 [Proteobacteria bacterium]|nr:hypothetical protein [Pseudomonadota bacterium]